MSDLKLKFQEVKGLIQEHLALQAKDECDNGVTIVLNVNASFSSIKDDLVSVLNHLKDEYGESELMSELEQNITNLGNCIEINL